MPRAFAKGLLTQEVLQQLHEERRARRDAFDAFTTTLQRSRRKRVRFAAKTQRCKHSHCHVQGPGRTAARTGRSNQQQHEAYTS